MMARLPPLTVAVLVTLTCPSDSLKRDLMTGPRPLWNSRPTGDARREVASNQLQMQESLGVWPQGDMYLNQPVVAQERTMPTWGTPEVDSRPAFSHVHSIFEAGQKGALFARNGVWVRHENATLVLSYHDGCPVQLYRIVDGALYSEVLGSPLERSWFRPTSILWPRHLVTLESLCQDRATLVSFVTVPAYDPRLRETLEPEQMLAEFPQHDYLISRLANGWFNADRTPLLPVNASEAVDLTDGLEVNYTEAVDLTDGP